MPESTRRLLRVLLPVVAVVIIVAGLWPRPEPPATDADRVAHVASRIRCPFCSGESIFDAPSGIARDLENIIAEQVADGWTDAEIYDYFEARYGEAALMDPPLAGWGWVLWAAPLAAIVVGGVAIVRRRRTPGSTPPVGVLERQQVDEQIAQIRRDLDEVERQVEVGDLDEDTAFDLAATYRAELAPLESQVSVLDAPRPEAEPDAVEAAESAVVEKHPTRRYVGAGILIVGALVVSVAAVNTVGEKGVVDVPTPPPIDASDLSTDQLEDVVARNPDIIGMRLALAKLYMEQGEVQRAVAHFGEVLSRERHPEALAWLGYISWQVGELETADGYLVEALAVRPDYAQAQWWFANLRFYGFEDAAGAADTLETLLTLEGLPEDVRAEAEQLLVEARAAS